MRITRSHEPVGVEVSVVRASKKALLLDDGGTEAWVAKSTIYDGGTLNRFSQAGAHGVVMLPRWVVEDKGFNVGVNW